MTSQEAKEILLLFRPGTADAEDPEVRAALELARSDSELGTWFEQHKEFQSAMRAGFRTLEAPEHFKLALVAAHKAQSQNALLEADPEISASTAIGAQVYTSSATEGWLARIWARASWQPVAWAGAAVAVALFISLSVFRSHPAVPDRFNDYRAMMVSKAVRGYNMDWSTQDMQELRQHFAQKGAPNDYQLSPGLQDFHLLGGASFTWRGNPVSMVCFKRGTSQSFWLFVMKTEALKDPPPQMPKNDGSLAGLSTASWTSGGNTYLLAGPEEPDFAKKYLPAL